MTEKRFKVEVSSDNYVHFTENGVNVISIGFKEYADAESCKYSLLPFCNRLNELAEENKELKSKYSEQCIQLDFLKDENQHMRTVLKENKELKGKASSWKITASEQILEQQELIKQIIELKEENKLFKIWNEALKEELSLANRDDTALEEENKKLKQRINELELLNNGLNYALQNIRKIDVEIDIGDELNE